MAQQQAERHGKAKAFRKRAKEVLASAAKSARRLLAGRMLDRDLMDAAREGDIAKINRLLKLGAKINSVNLDGYTALHAAAASGRTQACNLLIQKGADVNARTESNKTPLHAAAMDGYTKTCILLIENGADVNATTPHLHRCPISETASQCASQYGHKDTTWVLVFMELLAAARKEAPAIFLKSFKECLAS
jgi:ankyrin repeat protein